MRYIEATRFQGASLVSEIISYKNNIPNKYFLFCRFTIHIEIFIIIFIFWI